MKHRPNKLRKREYVLTVAFICSILLFSHSAASDEAGSAPDHYQEKCISCHVQMTGGDGSLLYLRKDRIVQNYQGLVKQIQRCHTNLNIDWDDAQTQEVIDYLNSSFYRFPTHLPDQAD